MKNIIERIAGGAKIARYLPKAVSTRLAVATFAALAAGGAWATDYTGTDYAPWSYSAGCVVWRATSNQLFHKSTIADVAADGTIGSSYDLDTTGHPWKAFASNGGNNYTAPGLTLVFDEAGYNGSSDAQFEPLSFGGLWVKVLQADDTPYCITDSKTDNSDRTVELGAANASTYFKFDKSFTFDRNSATKVFGTATVDIANGATFTINRRANKGAKVESGNTLVLTGSGTLAVVSGLTVGGTLDVSAATVPTIDGNVTLSAGSTLVLPSGTALNETISIPLATSVTAGRLISVKIGSNDPVLAMPTFENGAITFLNTHIFVYHSADTYPKTIPDDGEIYIFEGGETSESVATFTGVTVNGTLMTRGYVNLTDFTLNVGGTHEVVSETTTVTAAWNSTDNYGYVSGNITIDAGATYAVTQTDTINWANSGVQTINIYGTLALGAHRWSIMGVDHCVFNLYPGARITGTGDANGLLDLFATTSKLNCYAGSAGGDIYVEGLLKTRNANTPIWIAANTTLHLQGGLTSGGVAKSGNGTLALSGAIASTVANSSVTAGTFAFVDATGTALPLTVNANKSVTVSASSGVTVPLNVTMASGSSITVAGAGTVNGTVTMNALPGTTTDLTAASWAGTVSLAALSNPANVSVLQKLGSENSTLVLKGISSSAYIAASGNTTYTIACPIRLDGAVVIDNGSSGSTINLGKIFGTGNLTIAEWNGCSSVRYNLNAIDIDNYSGTLTLANNNLRTAGGTMTIGFGNLIKSNAAVGSVILPITTTAVANTTGTIAYNFDAGKVNGTAKALCVDTVNGVFGVYIAAASYSSTKYATVQEAINAAVADGHTYADVTILDATAECPAGYYVDTENSNALTKYQAALVDTEGGTHYFATPQAAVDEIGKYLGLAGAKTYSYYEVYYGENVAIAIDTATPAHSYWSSISLKIKCAVGASVAVTLASTESELTAGTADANGIVTYTKTDKATTYVWAGATSDSASTSEQNYARAGNWRVGTSSGATATRAPGSLDTVVFGNGAYASTTASRSVAALQVSGTVTFTGGGTLTSASAITLGTGDSITITGTLSPVPTTTVADSYVKATTSGSTTTYTVATQPTVSDVAFEYGADYATATVTATVSDAAPSYKLTVGGTEYTGSVSGSTVTFSNVATGRTAAYDDVSYEIAATSGSTAVPLVGDTSGSAEISDTKTWFSHDSSGLTGGTWATAVDLSEPATVADNKFTATAESTSSRVVLEFNVCFSSASDADVDGTAQAAIKIGEVESAATFMVLAPNNEWTAVSNEGLTPDAAKTYKVVMTIDYGGSGSYGVAVDNCVMTNASGSASFPLAASKKSVQSIDFAGSGVLTSMKGNQVEGYMVVDKNGTRYATISDAIAAYTADPTIGPLTVLHDGTPLPGWSIVTQDGVRILKKLAKGFFFMAY